MATTYASERGGSSGAQDYDYDIDRVIGENAEKIWRKYSDRQSKKHGLLAENPGKTGYDIAKVGDDYIIAAPEPLKERKKYRDLSEQIKREVKPIP